MSYRFADDHRAYIKRELQFRLQRRPLYSQRALARDLDLSPSTLTDFLKGRLALSSGRISQISKKLGLSEEEKQHWIDLTTFKFSKNSQKKSDSFFKIQSRIETEKNAISLDEFKAISQWHHFAFLELIEMNSTKYSNLKISAKALSLPVVEMRATAERLIALKLLSLSENQIYRVEHSTNVGNSTPSEAIRSFHHQILQKAQVAVDHQSIKERFVSSTLVGLPAEKIPVIIDQLKSLAHQIIEPHLVRENVNAGRVEDRDQLYCLSFQFFNLLSSHPPK
jgi:uncharacterized protein (TIGR02147 family)